MDSYILDVIPLLEHVKPTEIVNELLALRRQNLRLNKTRLNKRSFKYLKKLGIFDSFLPSDFPKWHSLSITEQVAIKIAETFWNYGFEVKVIKRIIEVLLSDTWLKKYIRDYLLDSKATIRGVLDNDQNNLSFIEYCFEEKKIKPPLVPFANLDALIISAITSPKPISIVVNKVGMWRVFTGLEKSDLLELAVQESMFRNSFINITIKGVLDELFFQNKELSLILNPNLAGQAKLDSLIRKGFDYKDIRELELDNPSVEIEVVDHGERTNIAQLIRKFSDNDVLVKTREGKISSIKQLVIKKLK